MKNSLTKDLIALVKPTITLMAILMAGGGMLLAPSSGTTAQIIFALIGTGLSVAAAMVLNQYLERDIDRLMNRTKMRPLPDQRVSPSVALWFGLALGFASILLLVVYVNLLTAFLAGFALVTYTLVYTPLKLKSPHALLIGAIPGAMPPLMGWTAVTNEIAIPGIILFFILMIWQLPHFIAIAIFHQEDYLNAGIKTVPIVRGDRAAKLEMAAYSTVLLPLSLLLVPIGVAGWIYFVAALSSGGVLIFLSYRGLSAPPNLSWARHYFIATLIYLPALTLGLILDVALRT